MLDETFVIFAIDESDNVQLISQFASYERDNVFPKATSKSHTDSCCESPEWLTVKQPFDKSVLDP